MTDHPRRRVAGGILTDIDAPDALRFGRGRGSYREASDFAVIQAPGEPHMLKVFEAALEIFEGPASPAPDSAT